MKPTFGKRKSETQLNYNEITSFIQYYSLTLKKIPKEAF